MGLVKEIVPLFSKAWHLRAKQENRAVTEKSNLFKQSREFGRLFIDTKLIRDFYGDEVAIYFEWMSHFQKYLIFPGIFSIIVYVANNTIYTFRTSPLSAWYSVFMTFWGIFFMIDWSRHQKGLKISWDNYASQSTEWMHMRKEFRGKPRISPVTDKPDIYFSLSERLPLYAVSAAVCLPCLFACIFIIICFLNATGVIRPEHHGGVFDIPMLSCLANDGAIFDPNGNLNMLVSVLQSVVTILINI